ncbi:MAG: glutathione S-transferase family protein [Pseudomonadota bacterium]
MDKQEFQTIVDAANVHIRPASRSRTVGSVNAGKPRFEVYHSAPSLCSHKVRTVLAEKRIPYLSHDMQIMPIGKAVPQNYRPGYVRMRLLGAPGVAFASGYTGASAVETEGFDPCVVPTLVDHEKCKVVVDSSVICDYIEREGDSDIRLVPAGMEDAIRAQIDIIDRAPHVAILYGANPDGDVRPPGLASRIEGVQDKKIVHLKAMMAQVPNEPDLIAAYKSKISKEAGSDSFVHNPEQMRQVYSAMAAHADALEQQLATHEGDWALGDRFTMADVMWSVSLYRLKWIGLGDSWERGNTRPRVAAYVKRAFARPEFHGAVIEWPRSYSPSPHVAGNNGPLDAAKFVFSMVTGVRLREVLFG